MSGIRPATRVGVVMETRPSALVTLAALSRLGAVAVLMAPESDLNTALAQTMVLHNDVGVRILVWGKGLFW